MNSAVNKEANTTAAQAGDTGQGRPQRDQANCYCHDYSCRDANERTNRKH